MIRSCEGEYVGGKKGSLFDLIRCDSFGSISAFCHCSCLHRMRRSTLPVQRRFVVSFVAAALVVWCNSHFLMGFSGPVAKARSGAGAKDYVLVMHQMCPFAQRAWFALEESGLSFQLKEVGLGSSLVYDLNPKGLVPVLVDPDGKVIAESEDIVDTIAERAGKHSSASEVASILTFGESEIASSWEKGETLWSRRLMSNYQSIYSICQDMPGFSIANLTWFNFFKPWVCLHPQVVISALCCKTWTSWWLVLSWQVMK